MVSGSAGSKLESSGCSEQGDTSPAETGSRGIAVVLVMVVDMVSGPGLLALLSWQRTHRAKCGIGKLSERIITIYIEHTGITDVGQFKYPPCKTLQSWIRPVEFTNH